MIELGPKEEEEMALSRLFAEVSAETGRMASQAAPLPDFGEVLRRARALDPAAVSVEMLDEAAELAAVVPLGRRRDALETSSDSGLEEFVQGARAHNEGLADERKLAGIPRLARAPRLRRSAGLMAFVGVAAGLALVWLGSSLGSSSYRGATPIASEALMQGIIDRSEYAIRPLDIAEHGVAVDRERRASAAVASEGAEESGRSAEPQGMAAGDADPPGEGTGGEDTPAEEPDSAEESEPEVSKPRARRSLTDEELAAELAALDDEAQAAWRRGDLKGAEKIFRRLIHRAPRGRWAHLAYGDLFNLIRQGGDARAEVALWREYLRRYPKGPHADDAQAGLCRRSTAADQGACWTAYLAKHPQGAYRQQATAALSSAEAGL